MIVETKDMTVVGVIAYETKDYIVIDDGMDYVKIRKANIIEMYEDED